MFLGVFRGLAGHFGAKRGFFLKNFLGGLDGWGGLGNSSGIMRLSYWKTGWDERGGGVGPGPRTPRCPSPLPALLRPAPLVLTGRP